MFTKMLISLLFSINLMAANSPAVDIRQGGAPISNTNPLGVRLTDGTSYLAVLPISASALPLPIGAATEATLATIKTDTALMAQSIAGADPGLAGVKSTLAGGKFNATLPTLTNGQQVGLQVDANGRLISNQEVTLGSVGAGALASRATLIAGTFNTVAPTVASGQQVALQLSASGRQLVDAQNQTDIARNVTTYHMTLPVVTTATDTLQSLTGYKSGAAVAATTTPAVVTAGKRYRITSITFTYVGILTAGSAKITLRANTAGVVAIGSPAVLVYIGLAPAATAGVGMSYSIPIPDGLEFAAGTGIGISMIGLSATQTAAASGYGQVTISGHEY